MSTTDPPGSVATDPLDKDTSSSAAPETSTSAAPTSTAVDNSAPLPSDVQPFPIACPCLNVVVESYGSDNLVQRFNDGKEASFGERAMVWLPENAEVIRHMPMSTFDKVGDEAWRKCWVCDTRVYSVKGKAAEDDKMAPINTWVDIDLSNGIIYGDKVDAARQRTPLIYSRLLLDVPTTSTFGRPPSSTTPVPYPAEPQTPSVLLPPIPDPFFLPPPFIPNHPALREMCKQAVAALQEKHDEIERDIRTYIVQRAQDMKRLEDQVRAEVEALWERYVQGPLHGQDVDRRGSVNIRLTAPPSRVTSNTGPPPGESKSVEKVDKAFERDRSRDSLPSGVVPSPPSLGTQFNSHTAVAASSLLSASLANNAFHAPPPRRAAQNINDIEALAETVSRENGVSREVAMSYAFSAMEEHAGPRRRRDSAEMAELKRARKEAEAVEEEAEEREKGIDSWAAMERSQVTDALAKEVTDVANAAKPSTPKQEPKHDDGVVANGSKDKKARAGTHVTFQEPDKGTIEKEREAVKDDGVHVDHDDDDDYVFEMDTDEPAPARPAVAQPEVKAPERQVRTMVEDNLSRTFAAEAPSHRAAWRAVERDGLARVLRRSSQDKDHDDDAGDAEYTPSDIGLARSVPINITMPARKKTTPLQFKTSLTDKKGVLVPNLIGAMRERGVDRSAPRAIAGSVAGTGRRGSRSASSDREHRERDQVKSYAADPGAVFESLAESAVSDDSDADDDATPGPTNGKFVPPHVLAKRAADKGKSKGESGW